MIWTRYLGVQNSANPLPIIIIHVKCQVSAFRMRFNIEQLKGNDKNKKTKTKTIHQ